MLCKYCGTQVSATAQLCENCGKPLSASEDDATSMANKDEEAVVDPSSSEAEAETEASVDSSPLEPEAEKGAPGPSKAVAASKKSSIKIAVGVVIIVVIVVVVLALSGLFSRGYSSSDQLAEKMTTAYQNMADEEFSESSLVTAVDTILDCMPQEALDAVLEQSGSLSRDELIEELDFSSIASGLSSLSSYLDSIDIVILASPGATLDTDEIDSINEQFDEIGLDLTVQNAQHLSLTITITAIEDLGTLSAGDSTSQTLDESGIELVEIDGSWYMWTDLDGLAQD